MSIELTWEEIQNKAREILKPRCMVCPQCNGRACAGKNPGPGGKGTGLTTMRNYDWLHEHVKFQMDAMGEPFIADTSIEFVGRQLSLPVMAAPIGMVNYSLSDVLDDRSYSEIILSGMLAAGSLGITGGSAYLEDFKLPLEALKKCNGNGIADIKPWKQDIIEDLIKQVEAAGVPAFLIDIDTAGLPHAGLANSIVERQSEGSLRKVAGMTKLKFIVKGIMTPGAAREAADAGVYAIVVSNHGGRVIDEGLSTAEVLPLIREAVGNRVRILVDGGIRTGYDVFKMIALGADAVLIGRPYMIAAYGGGAEGVRIYTEKIRQELIDIMNMTRCRTLEDITRDKIMVV